jgi:hypothetical protein
VRISANVTGDFGNVTDFGRALGCAVIVVVALGEPGTPLTCCAAAGTDASTTLAIDVDSHRMRLLSFMYFFLTLSMLEMVRGFAACGLATAIQLLRKRHSLPVRLLLLSQDLKTTHTGLPQLIVVGVRSHGARPARGRRR